MNTATWAEIVWSAGAGIGLLCNLWLLIVSVGDIQRLRRSRKNGPRTLVAKGNRRNEVSRVLKQGALLYFGIVACLTPPADMTSSDQHVTPLGVQLTIVLILVEVLLVVSAVLDLRDRRELIRLVDRMEDGNGHV